MKKLTVITGGAGGMGRAIAKKIGPEYDLVLADRSEEALAKAVEELNALGITAHTYVVDIADKASVEKLAGYAASLGGVKNVIHTAGVSPTNTKAEDVLKINGMGTMYMTEAFLPVMAGGGVMINFGSVAAYTLEPQEEWYDVFDNCEDEDFYDQILELVAPFQGDDFAYAGTSPSGNVEEGLEIIESLFLDSWDGYWASPEQMGWPLVAIGSKMFNYMSGQIIYLDYGVSATWQVDSL